jgi:hypothetical protein
VLDFMKNDIFRLDVSVDYPTAVYVL